MIHPLRLSTSCLVGSLLATGCHEPDPQLEQAYVLMGADRSSSQPPGALITGLPPQQPATAAEHTRRMAAYERASALIEGERAERGDEPDVLVAQGTWAVLKQREPIRMEIDERTQLSYQAAAAFSRAIELAPRDRDARWGLLMVHMAGDCYDFASCEQAAEGVLAYDSSNVLARYALTHALYGRRHITHAGLCIRFGPDATTKQRPRRGTDHP